MVHGGRGGEVLEGEVGWREKRVGEEGRIVNSCEISRDSSVVGRGGSGAPQSQIYVHTEGNQNEFFFSSFFGLFKFF